jgi:hypothetical protein
MVKTIFEIVFGFVTGITLAILAYHFLVVIIIMLWPTMLFLSLATYLSYNNPGSIDANFEYWIGGTFGIMYANFLWLKANKWLGEKEKNDNTNSDPQE